jgi:hypothetical protein
MSPRRPMPDGSAAALPTPPNRVRAEEASCRSTEKRKFVSWSWSIICGAYRLFPMSAWACTWTRTDTGLGLGTRGWEIGNVATLTLIRKDPERP